MNRTEKTAQIALVKSKFDAAISVTLVNFQGLSVETVTDLRRAFKKEGVEYKVFKNTVIRHAIKDGAYKPFVGDLSPDRKNSTRAHDSLRGMTGVAFCSADPAKAVQVLQKFKQDKKEKAEKLTYKAGFVGGQNVPEDKLAKMPGLKETQAHIYQALVGPAAQLYASLVMPGAYIVALLEAHAKGEGGKQG